MKRRLSFLLFLLMACSEHPETLIEHINGYWEIQEVHLPNGIVKQYDINETVDYIRINDSLKGFRKKLKPGVNGNYFTSEDAEAITLRIENDSLHLFYSTPFNSWKETVLLANDSELKVINENKTVYLYKRYTPITFDSDL